jgi:hypothetical protein
MLAVLYGSPVYLVGACTDRSRVSRLEGCSRLAATSHADWVVDPARVIMTSTLLRARSADRPDRQIELCGLRESPPLGGYTPSIGIAM